MTNQFVSKCRGGGIFLIILLTCITAYSQEDSLSKQHPSIKMNEIIFSTGLFYAIGEESLLSGFTLQYVRKLSHSKLGYGVAYEKLWDSNSHRTVGLVGYYYPILNFSVFALAGPTNMRSPVKSTSFGMHVGATYSVPWKYFLVGLSSELGYNNQSAHFMMGIKAGLPF